MTKASDYHAESGTEKFSRKTKEAPYVPLGIAAMLLTVGYGAYAYKNKGTMKTSVYLMHLRVRAQSMIVGAIALGVGYSMLRSYVWPEKTDN